MIDVALCPTEIERLSAAPLWDTTSVVFDVLRATSSIITGLAYGAGAIIPVETVEEAKARRKANPDFVLAGERGGVAPPGFDLGNSPREFTSVAGCRILLTTTNGTAAIARVRGSAEVLVGALLNIEALADLLLDLRPPRLLLVCAGTQEDFSLEDAIGAGALVERLAVSQELSDAAVLVRGIYARAANDLLAWLKKTRNGRALCAIGKELDVADCARLSLYNVVGTLRGDAIVRRG